MFQEEEERLEGLTEVRKWRLQVLLASHKYGIPSLALADSYKAMFNQELRYQQWGFDGLSDFISSLSYLITVQEPDQQTALLFPEYKHDRILHDARYGHIFTNNQAPSNPSKPMANTLSNKRDATNMDADLLISQAWLNRDDDIPDDVVLPGEEYLELVLPMSLAKLDERSIGLFQAMIVSVADPHHLYIHIKNSFLERLNSLSSEVDHYFRLESPFSVEMYSVPSEFLYPGFPCLVFNKLLGTFERVAIKKRSSKRGGKKILVETVDFGGELVVQSIDLFLMPRQFLKFPRQAIRVGLAGIKPAAGLDKWTISAGRRLRNFSNCNYWIECLLLPPPPLSHESNSPSSSSTTSSSISSPSSSSANLLLEAATLAKTASDGITCEKENCPQPSRRHKHQLPVQFEVILCDRNDDELDLFLDEVLVMETYANPDQSKVQHLAKLKEQLKSVMKSIARPKNPFLQ